MATPNKEIPASFEPRFLAHLDGRTVAAKVLRQRLDDLQTDLGGEHNLSYQQRSLCRRVIWLESYLETKEAESATGEACDIGRQVQGINSLIGLYRTLGIERRQRDVPGINDLIRRAK